MSIITSLLGLKIPPIVYEILAAILFVILAMAYLEHKGAQRELAKLQASSVALRAEVQKESDANAARAQVAETARATAEQQLKDYTTSHPDLDVSELCRPANRNVGLPKASGSAGGSQGSPATGTVGQPVPSRDNGEPYDRRALLIAFAALFDHTANNLRDWQSTVK